MPGMDGIETARRIKANEHLAQIPAMLMVTANGREEARMADRKNRYQGLFNETGVSIGDV